MENKIIKSIRKIAIILACVTILFSLCNTIYGYLYTLSYKSVYDIDYYSVSYLFSYFSSFFTTSCSAFILIIIAYFIDPEKIKPIFNKIKNIEDEAISSGRNDTNGTQNGIDNI